MEISWEAQNKDTLSLQKINEFEDALSVLLHNSMKTESQSNTGLLPDQTVLATEIHVKNVTRDNQSFQLNAIVDVLYVADDGVSDMASILIRLSRKDDVHKQLLNDIYDILGADAGSVVMNFRAIQTTNKLWQVEHNHNGGKADRSLILACTLLCAALVVVTSVLMYVAGGWKDLKERLEEQMVWFKEQRRTYSEDEDEESGGVDVADSNDDDDGDDDGTNPSGILGATSQDNNENVAQGLGIHRTPERGLDDDGYQTTPFSEMSKYSDTSRVPLGIQSMRKMPQPGRDSKFLSLPPLAYK